MPHREGIRTFWWRRMGLVTDRPNFGDELTSGIVHGLAGVTCTWAHPKRSEFIGAGSILEMVQGAGAPSGLKVWGSGFMASGTAGGRNWDHPDFDFYAVRGELTLSRIRPVRDVALGDPGLLASRVYPRSPVVTGKVGLVYHYVDEKDEVVRALAQQGRVALIDPSREPRDVIADITECEFIFSTSLHGLIVADSFGIPNAWIALSGRIGGGRYKFEDYYSAFGGTATQYDADLVWDPEAVEDLKRGYCAVPNLKEIQSRLIRAIPYL